MRRERSERRTGVFTPCSDTGHSAHDGAAALRFFGVNWKRPGRPGAIRRKEAVIWIVTFIVYTLLMFRQGT